MNGDSEASTLASTQKRRKGPERSRNPVADFANGYAVGWAMAVGECFRAALDIAWTEKTKKGETSVWLWTQGAEYNFQVGDTLHDIPMSLDVDWQSASVGLRLTVQVIAAHPAAWLDPVPDDFEDFGEKSEKRISFRRYPGRITFQEYRPIKDARQLSVKKIFDCTQDAFVWFLMTGIINTLDGGSICLLAKE